MTTEQKQAANNWWDSLSAQDNYHFAKKYFGPHVLPNDIAEEDIYEIYAEEEMPEPMNTDKTIQEPRQVPRELQDDFLQTAKDQMEKLQGLLTTRFGITNFAMQMMAHGYYHKDNEQAKAINEELLQALKEVVRISDRKHDAWDKAKSIIQKAQP